MLNGQRILVLEEQPLIAQLIVEMLVEMNCRVIGPASRLPEAVSLLVENDVDAAILDVKIEGQSTAPVAEELVRRAIPWAFASSNEAEEIGRRYPDIPIIMKPFNSGHLQAVLKSLLSV